MPADLKTIVQRMIDAGEPEEAIASVIKSYKPPAQEPTKPYTGPTTFWGGVKESLTSGEAAKAGLQGGLGWLKGATLDIPSSIYGGLQTIGNLVTSPVETLSGIPGALGGMWETAQQAGSDPEAFGRMMGQMTGQPLVTAGAVKAAPLAKPAIGAVAETAGRTMRKYQPVSGLIPRIAEMRTMRNIERGVGGKLENIGQRMRTPTVQGEIVPPQAPPFAEGQIVPPAQLPSSNVFYHPESMTPIPPPMAQPMGTPIPPKALPPSRTFYMEPPEMGIPSQTPMAATAASEVAPLPEEFFQRMGSTTPPTTPTTVSTTQLRTVSPRQMNPKFNQLLKKEGYEFVDMDDKGNFLFRKR